MAALCMMGGRTCTESNLGAGETERDKHETLRAGRSSLALSHMRTYTHATPHLGRHCLGDRVPLNRSDAPLVRLLVAADAVAFETGVHHLWLAAEGRQCAPSQSKADFGAHVATTHPKMMLRIDALRARACEERN